MCDEPSCVCQGEQQLPSKSKLELWRKQLGNEDPDVRLEAVSALAKAGGSAIPILIQAVGNKDYKVHRTAIEALSRMEHLPSCALRPLADVLSYDPGGADWALRALTKIGPEAVPTIEAALKDHELRRDAIEALGNMGPGAEAAVPSLKRVLIQRGVGRSLAAEALGKMGNAGLDALLEHAAAADIGLRTVVAYGIGFAVRPMEKRHIAVLATLLRDEDATVRETALNAVERLGPKAAALAVAVLAVFQDSHRPNRLAAASAAARLGDAAIPPLLKELRSADFDRQCLAAIALGLMAKTDKNALPALRQDAVPVLREALSSSRDSVRDEAEKALSRIETRPPRRAHLGDEGG